MERRFLQAASEELMIISHNKNYNCFLSELITALLNLKFS